VENIHSDNTLLRRSDAAAKLNEAGYPISAKTLATMASRGDGPLFTRFGRVPLYRVGDLIAWAEKRSSPFGHSVQECEAAREAAA
jgi:hypothetical protein